MPSPMASSEAPFAFRLAAGLTLALASAGIWGWASESLLVAGLTLVCAAAQVLARNGSGSPHALARYLAPLWIGMAWTAIDVVWARFGIGNWARLGY